MDKLDKQMKAIEDLKLLSEDVSLQGSCEISCNAICLERYPFGAGSQDNFEFSNLNLKKAINKFSSNVTSISKSVQNKKNRNKNNYDYIPCKKITKFGISLSSDSKMRKQENQNTIKSIYVGGRHMTIKNQPTKSHRVQSQNSIKNDFDYNHSKEQIRHKKMRISRHNAEFNKPNIDRISNQNLRDNKSIISARQNHDQKKNRFILRTTQKLGITLSFLAH